ncbi:hypothetical protein HYV70_03360 [Candidatus Uhrbacteria bacterium]|nr:hypothetical protein [Candidatus Uhrbacteria bacterium]
MSLYFLRSNTFLINRVEIQGIEYVDRTNLEKTITEYLQTPVFFFFSTSNTFLFSTEDLENLIMKQFSLASISINVNKKTLTLLLEERTSNLIWETAGKSYVVDLEGIIVREQEKESTLPSEDLPHFKDKNNASVTIGSQVLKTEEITHTFLFLEFLAKRSLTYTHIEIDRLAGKWMQVVTTNGFGILFDTGGNIETQYRNLEIILDDQAANLDRLEYIDLRFGDRVYFK